MKYAVLLAFLLTIPFAAQAGECKLHDGYFHKAGEPECWLGNGAYRVSQDVDLNQLQYHNNLDIRGKWPNKKCLFNGVDMPCEKARRLHDDTEHLSNACRLVLDKKYDCSLVDLPPKAGWNKNGNEFNLNTLENITPPPEPKPDVLHEMPVKKGPRT